MRPRRSLPVLACVALLAVAGCRDEDTEPTSAGLAGKAFESTSVDGRSMVGGTNVRIAFDEAGVAVSAGCNTLFGGVEIADGTLQVGTLAQTMMACTDDLMAQDEYLATFLTAGPTISLDGGTLTLVGADGTTIVAEVVD